ncbi:unnamed protein product [Debaryomyces tyrocola]|nr:unnamed protein product [Debaryomyces tyrocola]
MQIKKLFAISALSGFALGANTVFNGTRSISLALMPLRSSSTFHSVNGIKPRKACSFKDFTATKSEDIASIAACSTAVGDITIKGDSFGSIELNGVEELYGNLHVNNATEATSLNAATLQLVSGKLNLDGNTILATVNLAQLTTVGTLNYNALPALEKTGLTSGITSADEVIISDTGLTSLEGINVFKLKVFNVNNNADISTIDSGLQKVTDELSISYNAEKVDVSLDQLEEANDVYLQSINSLSVANLTKISNSLSLDSNALDTIEFKKLKSIVRKDWWCFKY